MRVKILVEPESTLTKGFTIFENILMAGATNNAIRSGLLMAIVLGSSSPITIEKYVITTITSAYESPSAYGASAFTYASQGCTWQASATPPYTPETMPTNVIAT